MKGFGIEIKNDLLDPKHIDKMGVSVWLYMYFLDKMTSVSEEGIGKVLGGKPLKFKVDIEPELGITERTYNRWIVTLKEGGYINVIRTPYGLSISVNKAFKRFGKSTERTATNGVSEPTKVADHSDKSGGSNKTGTVDNNSKTERGAKNAPHPAEEFFNSVEEQEKVVEFLAYKGWNRAEAKSEIQKFISYWTEPSKSGRKLRWQAQKFFDLRRRLTTWFNNTREFQRSNNSKERDIII